MIDIHSHILPKVDDGPSETEEALRILEKGGQEGITTFVLTPHLKEPDWQSPDAVVHAFRLLEQECGSRGIPVKLILGAEVYIVPDLHKIAADHPFATFGGRGKHMLVELPVQYLPIFCEEALYGLLAKGITPIIAHLERYRYLWNDETTLMRWSRAGMLFQLNASSLTGRRGWFTGRRSKKLLKSGFISFIASDVHAFTKEYSLLAHAFRIAAKTLGDATAGILRTNPERLIPYL